MIPSRVELDEHARKLRDLAELGEWAHATAKGTLPGSVRTRELAGRISSALAEPTISHLISLARDLLTWKLP